jgi:hypothetical protein
MSISFRLRNASLWGRIDAARVLGGNKNLLFSVWLDTDAEAVTKSDRYLMIATSGGLNQQRTGVRADKLPIEQCAWCCG